MLSIATGLLLHAAVTTADGFPRPPRFAPPTRSVCRPTGGGFAKFRDAMRTRTGRSTAYDRLGCPQGTTTLNTSSTRTRSSSSGSARTRTSSSARGYSPPAHVYVGRSNDPSPSVDRLRGVFQGKLRRAEEARDALDPASPEREMADFRVEYAADMILRIERTRMELAATSVLDLPDPLAGPDPAARLADPLRELKRHELAHEAKLLKAMARAARNDRAEELYLGYREYVLSLRARL